MTGKIFGSRYELLERVGGGGMAIVYKAHDQLLNRHVAVKVLRQQYVHDEEFISRFGREAQSAASLSHPNIVSMYDVGQQGEDHYIVMEYVDGMTLDDLIKEKAPLQVEDALHIAAQICDALEHAHSNEIVHRDIKPHNILMGRNGRIKVTDFGIARAATASSITQTGSVVGSVHYFSPEHAKGISGGAKSDIYSLGIVLYQMLTAKLPFHGESPISVALKHLQEEVEEPRKVNPLIPQSVENIILKAMRKNPDERYQSADEMFKDLDTALDPKRRNEPKLTFVDDDLNGEETKVLPAIRSEWKGLEEDDDKDEPAAEVPQERKRRIWIAPLVWTVLFCVFVAVMWYEVIPEFKERIVPRDVVVPVVVGELEAIAVQRLIDVNLQPHVVSQFSLEPEGFVVDRSPQSEILKENAVVTLFVSQGVEPQQMSNYTSRLFRDVRVNLVDAGFRDDQILYELVADDLPEDTIISHSPGPGEQIDPINGTMMFIVSRGPETVHMPDLIGRNVQQAEAILMRYGLALAEGAAGREEVSSYDMPSGQIVDTYPFREGDEVDPDVPIKVFVSSGPPEDAVTMNTSVTLTPAQQGQASQFRIMLTDAQFDAHEYTELSVVGTQTINVRVTLTPVNNAHIQVLRNNSLVDTITLTYENYLEQQNPSPPTPTIAPTDAPTDAPTAAPAETPEPTAESGSTGAGEGATSPAPSPETEPVSGESPEPSGSPASSGG